MTASDPSRDEDVRQLADAGRYAEAATALVQRHGPGVLGYLHALSSSRAESEELFSDVCERLWRKLPAFEWSGSIRTWMYVTARNALIDARRRQGRRPMVPLSSAPELAAAVRSTTEVYRRSETKGKLSEVRDELDADDRTLLILRVDREMSWNDIARVMAEGEPDEAELERAGARLRKRFERLKERIRNAMLQG